jgi:catechol 2,3-dioxygenase-like lactoylglutathione lyase family enzyme
VFSHIFVGVNDFEIALAFYRPVMDLLGAQLKFVDSERPCAGWQPRVGARPLLFVGGPFDKRKHSAGNGQMVAFLAPDRVTVDDVHRIAVLLGAKSEGAPGLRPEYHANYYGAYVRDPEGNKLCFVCHDAPR